MFEEDDNEPDPHCKELAQLPPYTQRTWQPVEPDPVRHRRQPLRHPQYRIPLVPLIAVTSTMLQDGAIRAPFLIPGVGSYLPT
nr:glycoside hydrolase [Rhizobium phaseoli]